jgi:adsorption protein B
MLSRILTPLAIAILISGFDDLLVDIVWAVAWLWERIGGGASSEENKPERQQKRIAIFVPLWREHAVIRRMLEHNIAAIDYENYDIFIGAYPNDDPTLQAIREIGARYHNVFLAVCPHEGPTSKADCLNWIYQRMLIHEEECGVVYQIVVTHDAEDIIHPQSLSTLAQHSDRFDMVQIPVLPLPTGPLEIVHGIYCDEFSESQTKDMRVRRIMGSFTPSSGVGTGYSREALDRLAMASNNCIFEPGCLTEDYENGMRLHHFGCPQIFIPLAAEVATREYFPRDLRSAIRQRTRWMTGIALQTWERHGWKGSLGDVYWLWRDRKGLIGNPLSLATNILFVYCLATCWWMPAAQRLGPRLAAATLALLVYRTAVRMACVGRIYGPMFALAAPLRSVCANFINAMASFLATYQYARAKIRREPLRWLKTEHGYPSRAALATHKRKLGEILAGSGYIGVDDLSQALSTKPPELRLGEYLVMRGALTESDLYEALSLQQGLPAGAVNHLDVAENAARALPRHVMRSWRVLPFRIAYGSLHLATPEVPTDDMTRDLRGFTGLDVRFQLITPENFETLMRSH